MASTHTHTSRDRHRKALMHAGPARDSLQYSKFQTFFLFGPESWVFLVSVYSSAVETLLSAFVHGFLDHSDKMLIQGKKYPRGVCTLVHGISCKVTVSLTRQQVDVRPRTSAIDIRLPIPDLFSAPPPPLPQPTRTHHGLPLGHPNNYRLFIEHYLPQPAAKLQVPKAILKNFACVSFPFSCLASANNRASTRYPHTYIQVVHARAHQRIALHVCAEHIHKYLCASTSAYKLHVPIRGLHGLLIARVGARLVRCHHALHHLSTRTHAQAHGRADTHTFGMGLGQMIVYTRMHARKVSRQHT